MGKGLNIISGFIGAAFKVGSAASKELSKSRKQTQNKIAKAREYRRQFEEEVEFSRLKLIDNFSNQEDVNEYSQLESLQAISAEWNLQFKELRRYIDRGKYFEASNQFQAAIEAYDKAIQFGESSSRLNYANYAHPIKRVVILLGKLKEKERLKEYLQGLIRKHPNAKEVPDWSHRLLKLSNVN